MMSYEELVFQLIVTKLMSRGFCRTNVALSPWPHFDGSLLFKRDGENKRSTLKKLSKSQKSVKFNNTKTF